MKEIYITAPVLVEFKQALQMIFIAGIRVSEVPFITIETVLQGDNVVR